MTGVPPGKDPRSRSASRRSLLLLLLLLAICYAVAALGGVAATDAGSTYRSLERPAWAPPSWLFGPVWTVLYATIAVSAWLVLRRRPLAQVKAEIVFWGAQLAFNLAWTPLFFTAGRYGLAFLDICLLLAALGATMLLFRRTSPAASLVLVPYALWTLYAAALNLAVWQLNA
ncbi:MULTISPECIES: TspO/MBR family protein [unclassified Streptomyces]|uniref:TspO/MBR family protein n=1 Tax=unclassified Streptomyces TaxID=2593676 RepID=UPI0005AB1BCF|nr:MULTISPECIES: TspO/MBR family protein [unclassified Streptomyces]ODA73540.1 TspO/MBR family protein [Streptomyces sp. AVP053U2]